MHKIFGETHVFLYTFSVQFCGEVSHESFSNITDFCDAFLFYMARVYFGNSKAVSTVGVLRITLPVNILPIF